MRTSFARSIAFIACIHLLGGHWLALQTVAWIGMFATNAQEVSVSAALEKTFDGKHPCPLCHAVESGQKKEKERDESILDSNMRLIAVLFVAMQLPPLPVSDLHFFVWMATPDSVAFVPQSPPPQHA